MHCDFTILSPDPICTLRHEHTPQRRSDFQTRSKRGSRVTVERQRFVHVLILPSITQHSLNPARHQDDNDNDNDNDNDDAGGDNAQKRGTPAESESAQARPINACGAECARRLRRRAATRPKAAQQPLCAKKNKNKNKNKTNNKKTLRLRVAGFTKPQGRQQRARAYPYCAGDPTSCHPLLHRSYPQGYLLQATA